MNSSSKQNSNQNLDKSPTVSVIVPNFNHEKYLEQRIESILNQTFFDFELILLDDASTDESTKILRRYRNHPKVKTIVENARNAGSPYIQWNRGASLSSGRYLWIAESDDFAATTFLERMVGVLEKNPTAGIAYCRSNKVDEASRVFGSTADWTASLHQSKWDSDHVANGREECTQYWTRRCIIPNVSSSLIRLDILRGIGFADESMRFCGDYSTYTRILAVSDVAYIADALNNFRFSAGTVRNKMSKAWLHDLERARVIRNIIENLSPNPSQIRIAREEFLESILRSTMRSFGAAKVYITGYKKMRSELLALAPYPEMEMASLVIARSLRKIRQLL
ncbi:glycosyltransferase family A protein [Ideonella sp. DXS22W]|uniref:Glycosyltransferase family A protein n=1 Tax=Pseudaquabacterium inlustre TaxID=2984192 RepID=A0ABU9CS05_9BURK